MFQKICMMGVEILDENEVEKFDGLLVEAIDEIKYEDIILNDEVLKTLSSKPNPFIKGECCLVIKDDSPEQFKKVFIMGNGIKCWVSLKNERMLNSHFKIIPGNKKISLEPTRTNEGNYCWWNKFCKGNTENCDGNCISCEKYQIQKTDNGYRISDSSIAIIKSLIQN